ncbi:uncharacterized protein K444DRAFT_541236, partial [Hyaloscypha bicolor E]
LRAIFLTNSKNRSIVLYLKAIAIYEIYTQEFLEQVLILFHIPGSPLLQVSELLLVI